HGGRKWRCIVLGELASDLQREGAHATARELGEEPAEDLGERQVRADDAGGLGRQERRIHRVPCAATLEYVEDLSRDLLGDEDLGFGRRCSEMRREQGVRGG